MEKEQVKTKPEEQNEVVTDNSTSIDIEKQLAESNDKYVRLYADFQNYKNRTQREKEDLVSSTRIKMLNSILDMDNDISIAIKSVSNDEAKEGLNLIGSKLESFLISQGIEEIQTQTYDDNLHEVISIMEIGESKIIDVISKGYKMNDKPFRYPKIILGK